ncbi:protein lplB [Paenibacillus sp. MY03]|jgi:putative aldouronate transport system permease protein|uniref:Sugar ABC transporter permease n=1 Tax=Paenibacillus agaridevorans TaxID=171404 RepID=A0A2R5EYB2_9BACL|nr:MULTISPECIES: ABC transporter permease subunit [Paenibacillus]OUS78452.1 protein lplB [Paenibacillus sp. MY03]GBG11706.1 sugar ABC transporter permease [Paenibacillus agaridevorans]
MNKKAKTKRELPLHFMLLPGALLLIVYSYIPMTGVVIAFQKFVPINGLFGSKWIGLDNFRYVLQMPDIWQVLWNTIFIASMKIIVGQIVPIAIALLLNEMRNALIKRGVQTLIYLPHFLSWVILGAILVDILSPSQGIVNQVLGAIGLEPVYFLGSNSWFPGVLIASEVWKEFGFSTIVYLAAITGINPALYEAAIVDGASHTRQVWHITLPGMVPIIILLATLSLGNVLNAGFDQVFNLYSPSVYQSGDILDTLIYRIGLVDAQFGVATAIGFFKSCVSLVLISISYYLAYRLANYRIF